jgi:hypothetical protein
MTVIFNFATKWGLGKAGIVGTHVVRDAVDRDARHIERLGSRATVRGIDFFKANRSRSADKLEAFPNYCAAGSATFTVFVGSCISGDLS